jgi:hypothetical protein
MLQIYCRFCDHYTCLRQEHVFGKMENVLRCVIIFVYSLKFRRQIYHFMSFITIMH